MLKSYYHGPNLEALRTNLIQRPSGSLFPPSLFKTPYRQADEDHEQDEGHCDGDVAIKQFCTTQKFEAWDVENSLRLLVDAEKYGSFILTAT
jgi:hypothetical protein